MPVLPHPRLPPTPHDEESFLHYGPPEAGDAIPALRQALKALHAGKIKRLRFPPGEYHFHAEEAAERFCFVSNNHEGLKRIAFPLIGLRGVEIDGGGSRFIFHGRICPFLIEGCEAVRLRDFSIDTVRPTFSQGEVLEATPTSVTLHMDEEHPYFFENGRVWFHGPDYLQGSFSGSHFRRDTYLHALEFDRARREPAYLARDHYRVPAHHVREAGEGLLRLEVAYPAPLPRPGNILVLTHDHRDSFGICISESRDITLQGITLHHAGAMGIIAQRSEDLNLEHCTVTPPPGSRRMVSTFADASHFSCCRGSIRLTHCRFENMMDDPVNVHGIYSPIRRIHTPRQVEIVNAHEEQAGICSVDAGTPVRVIDRHTLLPLGQAGVRRVEPINRARWMVELEEPLPAGTACGDCLESLHWVPDVQISDCYFGKNRARGPLISSAGHVLITGNTFHHGGSAIKISGDANSWYESGAVREVRIENNVFDNCGYGVWGRGIIAIDPEISPEHYREEKYHSGIAITNNHFIAFDKGFVYARCVDRLTLQGNTLESSTAYPPHHRLGDWVVTENTSRAAIQSFHP